MLLVNSVTTTGFEFYEGKYRNSQYFLKKHCLFFRELHNAFKCIACHILTV